MFWMPINGWYSFSNILKTILLSPGLWFSSQALDDRKILHLLSASD